MDWQSPVDSYPTSFITDEQLRMLLGKPPVTGAWRQGDPVGQRKFVSLGDFLTENDQTVAQAVISYEMFGRLSQKRDNAVFVFHALTGDSHMAGPPSAGHTHSGWWDELVGPGKSFDTDRFCFIVPNVLGGCQGSTGPASLHPNGREWGSRFPYLTVRDQARAAKRVLEHLDISRCYAVIGGSMGGMHALEFALLYPHMLERLAVIAAPAITTADQIGLNLVQLEAIRSDPNFHGGNYYDLPDGQGPHNGLATARRIALLSYRSAKELNERFSRSWQSAISPIGRGGRFAVESYLDFHGNKFTRRFDAGSYVTLVQSMNSHDVGRGRGGVEEALSTISVPTLVLGIPTDRLFPVHDQDLIAKYVPGNIDGDFATRIESPYGHDAFLIEHEFVGSQLRRLLEVRL